MALGISKLTAIQYVFVLLGIIIKGIGAKKVARGLRHIDMRKGGGKSKGSAFERKICVDLSLWVSSGENKDLFWRSAMSGGRSTVAMKKGTKLSSQAGDVSSIHKLGHSFIDLFVVECKAYKTLNFESIIKGNGKLLEFWRKLQTEADEHDKLPLLVGKQNNHPVVACLSSEGIQRLSMNSLKRIHIYDDDLTIVLWSDFLKRNPSVVTKQRIRL